MEKALDLEGRPRVDTRHLVDIGCYELVYIFPGTIFVVH